MSKDVLVVVGGDQVIHNTRESGRMTRKALMEANNIVNTDTRDLYVFRTQAKSVHGLVAHIGTMVFQGFDSYIADKW